jgi:hypothetical protein
MKSDMMRRAIRLVGFVLPMSWIASTAAGQMPAANAQAFGVAVNTSTVNQTSPYAVLPIGGDMVTDQGQSVAVANLVTAQDAFAIVTGDADPTYGSNAVSSATLGAVNLLNGLITTDGVVSIATSTLQNGVAASNAEGSSLSNLVVNGVSVLDPAPNTRIDLPGTGYVLLNEQRVTGDGVTTSGITVNMIHVVLQQPILGASGDVLGYQTVGNVIIGSASSSVN